jgi:GDP-4-dehydro-6-deoxy-D-mannose reductase
MRILLIGASGFMGGHLLPALREAFGAEAEILATGRPAGPHAGIAELDIGDEAAVRNLLAGFRPDHVVNLAGIAAPAAAGRDPEATWRIHLDAVRHLGLAMLDIVPAAQLVNTGTGLAYGASFLSGTPVDEAAPLRPLDDYGASKAAGDLALGVLAGRGLRAVLFRPFNQIGPGQTEDFVIPAFAAQIARIEAGRSAPVIQVGNLDAERDFVDVRDVVRAYVAALARADTLAPGTVFNLSSGTPRRIGDVLDALLARAAVPIRVAQDPARLRASDVPRASGSNARAGTLLGWAPAIPFPDSLAVVLDEQRRHAGRSTLH